MNVRTTALLLPLALGLLAAPLCAEADQADKVHQIGVLAATSPAASAKLLEAFRQGLREVGWIEGQNLAIEYRWAEGRYERFPDFAAELVRLKVDLIFASSPPAIRAAKQATTTIPIVVVSSADPVEHGFVASLARPGGNVTGLTLLVGPEIGGRSAGHQYHRFAGSRLDEMDIQPVYIQDWHCVRHTHERRGWPRRPRVCGVTTRRCDSA